MLVQSRHVDDLHCRNLLCFSCSLNPLLQAAVQRAMKSARQAHKRETEVLKARHSSTLDRDRASAREELENVRKQLTSQLRAAERQAREVGAISEQASGLAASTAAAKHEKQLQRLRAELAAAHDAKRRAVEAAEAAAKTRRDTAVMGAKRAGERAVADAKAQARKEAAAAAKKAATKLAAARQAAEQQLAEARAKLVALKEAAHRQRVAQAEAHKKDMAEKISAVQARREEEVAAAKAEAEEAAKRHTLIREQSMRMVRMQSTSQMQVRRVALCLQTPFCVSSLIDRNLEQPPLRSKNTGKPRPPNHLKSAIWPCKNLKRSAPHIEKAELWHRKNSNGCPRQPKSSCKTS